MEHLKCLNGFFFIYQHYRTYTFIKRRNAHFVCKAKKYSRVIIF